MYMVEQCMATSGEELVLRSHMLPRLLTCSDPRDGMGRIERYLSAVAAPAGAAWIVARRGAYRRGSRPMDARALERLGPYFPRQLLARVEVARVECIGAPLAGGVRRLAPRGMLDLTTVRGMAFIDTVVVATRNCRPGDDEVSLLFHELVHIAQYEVLGTRGFVAAYLRGWLEAGRSYTGNPMEAMAYELQDRFDAGAPHDVMSEVTGRLAGM